MHKLLWVVAMAVFGSGCGIFGGYASCDFREGSVNGAMSRCQEVTGISVGVFKGGCAASGGKAGDGRCPSMGVIGGCNLGTQGDGTQVFDWYYEPMTVDQAKKECDKTFVDSYK